MTSRTFRGGAKRSQSRKGQRTPRSRCTTIRSPSHNSTRVSALSDVAGATTWTVWPRRERRAARSRAKWAAPLTSGGKVSAPIRMRNGSVVESGNGGDPCLESVEGLGGRHSPCRDEAGNVGA